MKYLSIKFVFTILCNKKKKVDSIICTLKSFKNNIWWGKHCGICITNHDLKLEGNVVMRSKLKTFNIISSDSVFILATLRSVVQLFQIASLGIFG